MNVLRQIKIKELRKDIQKGLESGTSISCISFDPETIKAEGRKRITKKKKP